MQALFELVEEREIPGITAHASLLKAKFRFKQGRTEEAKKIFKKILKNSKTSTMKYLQNMAESLVPDLIVS
jgi:hypothetical protein